MRKILGLPLPDTVLETWARHFVFALESCGVLVWKNDTTTVHACAYLGNGLVLNKNSQAWYSPRQVLRLETVLERWNEPELTVHVYSR